MDNDHDNPLLLNVIMMFFMRDIRFQDVWMYVNLNNSINQPSFVR